jgi:hypothetical protein
MKNSIASTTQCQTPCKYVLLSDPISSLTAEYFQVYSPTILSQVLAFLESKTRIKFLLVLREPELRCFRSKGVHSLIRLLK